MTGWGVVTGKGLLPKSMPLSSARLLQLYELIETNLQYTPGLNSPRIQLFATLAETTVISCWI